MSVSVMSVSPKVKLSIRFTWRGTLGYPLYAPHLLRWACPSCIYVAPARRDTAILETSPYGNSNDLRNDLEIVLDPDRGLAYRKGNLVSSRQECVISLWRGSPPTTGNPSPDSITPWPGSTRTATVGS